ncbi:MAG TPA: hypothetical protein VFJ74_15750 [Gemmatimonadaceae bacterium]|nr:hypothetical protein [Gemmatimonadaceae bacterium]
MNGMHSIVILFIPFILSDFSGEAGVGLGHERRGAGYERRVVTDHTRIPKAP